MDHATVIPRAVQVISTGRGVIGGSTVGGEAKFPSTLLSGQQGDTIGDMLAARHEGAMQRSAAAAQAWAQIKWRDVPTRSTSDGAVIPHGACCDGKKAHKAELTAHSTASSTADAAGYDACTVHVGGGADEWTCKRMLTVHGTNTKCVYGAFGATFHQQLYPAPAASRTNKDDRQSWSFAGSFGSEASMTLEDAPGAADFNLAFECDHDRDTTVQRRDST
mmetsp:Transcript_75394/g.122532  ORF Transcript_75394/g.122532 Transcript_75394/m.122532 type:complete len:220 (+) Transcript_75394:48-707(+)|eukprot:CAMPEP_0179445416 /NCGR_PEP_ID=MMETSP0799-20121207/28847_1 /TAXON_ID=46947 /ORGANISM="Geminigera cryophila, Strain CCMP2564" /LENGTH=219 /DNA_ID=CAMNT_0021233407 /DNA_START=45 /DNA_END=704 /DNA_ORIENTATION=-